MVATGVVCSLFNVEDVSYATALEVTAGGRLYNVVVDNEATAKKLLERGQLQTRVTFIPLNKIEGRSIDDRTTSMAKTVVGKDKCHTAISLIGFEHELAPAMKYIFGSSFVCNNLEDARKVTFHDKIMRKTVTLDGDVVDPAGTLTGGSRASGLLPYNILFFETNSESLIQLLRNRTEANNLNIPIKIPVVL